MFQCVSMAIGVVADASNDTGNNDLCDVLEFKHQCLKERVISILSIECNSLVNAVEQASMFHCVGGPGQGGT